MIILRRLFTLTAALYFLRSLTMVFTSLPVATHITDCQPKVCLIEKLNYSIKTDSYLFIENN
jgi:hypothetical protein